MKKYFIIAVAALVALASCTKTEADKTAYEQSRQINFSTVTGMNTKAPLSGTVYKTTDPTFGVFCYALTGTKTWAANSGDGQAYMNNVEISYDEDDKIWEPSSTYYWPLSGSLTFTGYSPYATTGTVAYAPATKALTVTNFTVNSAAASQQDLMWASTQKDCTYDTTTDKTLYTAEAAEKASTTLKGVKMVFHHALCQVKFAVRKKTADLDGYTITVNSITFDAYSKGTMTVTDDATPVWSSQAKQEGFVFNTTGADVEAPNSSESYAAFGVANMPVPQTLATGVQTFTITYSLAKGSVDLGQRTVTAQDLLGATVTAWAPNTIYTYNIDIDLNKIYFSPSIVDWTTGSSQQIDVK